MERYNSFLITEDHEMMKEYKKTNKSRSWYMPAGTKEHLFKFLCNFPINIFKSFKAYLKVKPDVIIATGAHTTVPICYIAKLFGKKVFLSKRLRISLLKLYLESLFIQLQIYFWFNGKKCWNYIQKLNIEEV